MAAKVILASATNALLTLNGTILMCGNSLNCLIVLSSPMVWFSASSNRHRLCPY